MPVILAPGDYARWLGEEPDPRDLMRPFPAELMRMWPISTPVNKPENEILPSSRSDCKRMPPSADALNGAPSMSIGASRLQQISHILQVPVAFFFEGAPNASAPHGSNGSALSMAEINDFISDSDGLRLIGAFMRIDNAALRRSIAKLVQEIAGDDD